MARVIWCLVIVTAAKSDDSLIQDREVCSLLQTTVNGKKLRQSPSLTESPEYLPWVHQSQGVFPLANGRVPPQLLMTGQYESIEDLPSEVRGNLAHTLELTPGLHVRYMNDTACRDYLMKMGETEMAGFFDTELHGSFKGDICRTFVLSQEGGFYMDLDFQLHVPLHSLIDVNTTLMTVFAAGDGPIVLNALIAVEPKSEAIANTLEEMKQWYRKGSWAGLQGLLGPTSMARGILQYMRAHCPEKPMNVASSTQRACGANGYISFYQEEKIGLGDCKLAGEVVCPVARRNSAYDGVKFGVFKLGNGAQQERLIGWPRIASCDSPGCGYQGGSASLLGRDTVGHATKAAHGHGAPQ